MPTPGRCGGRGAPDALGDPRAEAAEAPQGKPLPRGAIGAIGEVPLTEVDGVMTGGITVKDLKDVQVHGGDRVEDPVAPGILLLLACLLDSLGGKFMAEVLPETAQNGDDTWRHGRAPSRSGWLCATTRLPEVPPVLKSLQTVQNEEFVH